MWQLAAKKHSVGIVVIILFSKLSIYNFVNKPSSVGIEIILIPHALNPGIEHNV